MIAAVLLAWFLNAAVMFLAVVPSGSMEETVKKNDIVLCVRKACFCRLPERGDIVVFRCGELDGGLLIKRIIAVPGESVAVSGGQVYVNGSRIRESYLGSIGGNDFTCTAVPDGCFFVLGDNRGYSNDSRYWDEPFVSYDSVIAFAVGRVWPEPHRFTQPEY